MVEIFSPSAPTTKSKAVPVSRALPLNFVSVPMAVISSLSAVTSVAMAVLSSVDSVPLSYCTFRSRMRLSIECTSLRAPSAVWTSETPSCALRWAWARPPI